MCPSKTKFHLLGTTQKPHKFDCLTSAQLSGSSVHQSKFKHNWAELFTATHPSLTVKTVSKSAHFHIHDIHISMYLKCLTLLSFTCSCFGFLPSRLMQLLKEICTNYKFLKMHWHRVSRNKTLFNDALIILAAHQAQNSL